MKNLITKNNVWGVIGVILLVMGQFFHKETFSVFGVNAETNLVQLVGSVLILHPVILKIIEMYKDKQ